MLVRQRQLLLRLLRPHRLLITLLIATAVILVVVEGFGRA